MLAVSELLDCSRSSKALFDLDLEDKRIDCTKLLAIEGDIN